MICSSCFIQFSGFESVAKFCVQKSPVTCIIFSLVVFVLLLSDPFDSLAVLPEAEFDDVGRVFVDADALLLAVAPRSVVLAAVGPREYAVPVLFVVVVVARVRAAVGPAEVAATVHFITHPVAFKHATVRPPVLAETMYIIV